MNLKERFKIDFGKRFDSIGYHMEFKKSGWLETYAFFSVFSTIDHHQLSVVVCENIDQDYKKIPKGLLALESLGSSGQYNLTLLSQNPPFLSIPHNRNVYIYCKENLIDIKELTEYFLNFQLRVIIRDKKYFEMQKADFFISHDSRDKNCVARPLYEELVKRGFKVWYDEYSLKIGDSLTESIEKGITESRHGILILSKNFLNNEKWAKNELQSLKTKQIFSDQKVILPVWHQITEEDLKENYWLLDKLGGNTNNGIEELVNKLVLSFED